MTTQPNLYVVMFYFESCPNLPAGLHTMQRTFGALAGRTAPNRCFCDLCASAGGFGVNPLSCVVVSEELKCGFTLKAGFYSALPLMIQGAGSVRYVFLLVSFEMVICMISGSPIPNSLKSFGMDAATTKSSV